MPSDGSSTRHGREQRRLTCIGETYQSDIGQQLQFENDGHFFHRFAWLRKTRSLVGSRTELEVAQSATTSFQQEHFLSVIRHIAYILASFGIVDDRSARHIYVLVLSVLTVTFVASAVAAVFGEDMTLEFQMEQCPVVVIATQINAAAIAAVAAVRPAVRLILGMTEMGRSTTALSRTTMYLHIVYKVGFWHILYLKGNN